MDRVKEIALKELEMELLKAETTPVSLDHPTFEENQKTEALEHYLQYSLLLWLFTYRQLGLYETKEEVAHREEVLESLQVIVRQSIKQILEAKVYSGVWISPLELIH